MARIIVQHQGVVDIKTTADGEYTEKITLDGERILHGIWSIFEQYQGKRVVISVEEIKE